MIVFYFKNISLSSIISITRPKYPIILKYEMNEDELVRPNVIKE